MSFHQVGSGGADDNVFVDDRCPTMWQAPRFSSSPRGLTFSGSQARHHENSAQAAQNERDAALYTTKVKPIEGNLLRKLHKATVEEKLRTSSAGAAKQKPSDETPWVKKVKSDDLPGFRIPSGVGTPRPKVKEKAKESPQPLSQAVKPRKKKEKFVPQATAPTVVLPAPATSPVSPSLAPALPSLAPAPNFPASVLSVESEAVTKHLVRIASKHDEEVFVEIPIHPSGVPEMEADDNPPSLPPVVAEEPRGKRKKNKKNKKQKKRDQTEDHDQIQKANADQANIEPDHIFALPQTGEDDGSNDGDAFMSGALPAISAVELEDAAFHPPTSIAGFDEVFKISSSSSAISKKDIVPMQPTVESVISRLSTRGRVAPVVTPARTSSARTVSTRLSSFRSFEEVGEAWVGSTERRDGSAHATQLSASKTLSEQSLQEVGQRWTEAGAQVQHKKRSTPSLVLSINTAKSYEHPSPRVVSTTEWKGGEEETVRDQLQALKTQSASSSHRHSSLKMSHSARHSFAESPSRTSSLEHSPSIKSYNYESERVGSPVDALRDSHSLESSRSRPSPAQALREGSLAGDRVLRSSHSGSKKRRSHASRAEHESLSARGFSPAGERPSGGSKHSKQSSRPSRSSHSYTRHASTRSFSPAEDLWDRSPSIKSSAKSHFRRSSSHRSQPVSQHSTGQKHSVIKSVLGSVASMVSKVRSELTFEEVGQGWRNGGVTSGESKRESPVVRSSIASVAQVLNSPGKDDWEKVELPQSPSTTSNEQQHSLAVSRQRSQHSSAHSRSHISEAFVDSTQRPTAVSHMRSPVGAPVRSVISSLGSRSGIVSVQEGGNGVTPDRARKQRPTVFAGRGWITPHPLESSVAYRTPEIVLPSDAIPTGETSTLTYDEWKAIQENGIRGHRNFSMTESNDGERNRHKNDRYRFSGWESRSWQEVKHPDLDPDEATARPKSRSSEHTIEHFNAASVREVSILGPLPIQSHHSHHSEHAKTSSVSSSERVASGSVQAISRSSRHTRHSGSPPMSFSESLASGSLQARSQISQRSRHRQSPLVEPNKRLSPRSLQTHSQHSRQSHHPSVSSSERLWEKMEEGDAWGGKYREDSVLSDRDRPKAYSEWSEVHSRRSRSGSRQR